MQQRVCTKCKNEKPVDQFYCTRGISKTICKVCQCASNREYHWAHREEIRAYKKRWYDSNGKAKRHESYVKRLDIKRQVLSHYGNSKAACVFCGERRISCLSLDHINDGGFAHRKQLGILGGRQFYQWLIREGLPEGYQTLCMNCQWMKRAKTSPYYREDLEYVE